MSQALLMMDLNNQQLAAVILAWLADKVPVEDPGTKYSAPPERPPNGHISILKRAE
jgi:hypothetical protein